MNKFKYLSDSECAAKLREFELFLQDIKINSQDRWIFTECAERLEDSLEDKINIACRDLGINSEIQIILNQGSATIQGYQHNTGDYIEHDGADESLAEQVVAMTKYLIESPK